MLVVVCAGVVPAQLLKAQSSNTTGQNQDAASAKSTLVVEASTLSDTMLRRMQAEETRLQQMLDKISARNENIKNNGIDTSPVGTMLVGCQIKVDSAGTLIRAIEIDVKDLPTSPYPDRIIQSITGKSEDVDATFKEVLTLEKETLARLKSLSAAGNQPYLK